MTKVLLQVLASFFILLLPLMGAPALGEEGFERLDEVRVKMEEAQTALARIQGEFTKGQSYLKNLQGSIKALTDKEQSLKRELGKVESSQRETQEVLSQLQTQIDDLEALSLKRVKALYMTGGPQADRFYLTSQNNFDQATVYLSHIRSFDQKIIEDLRALRNKRDSETGKLTKLQKDHVELLQKLEVQRQDLVAQYQEQKDVIAALEEKRRTYNSTLLGLKAQALRLETVLKGLTGGEEAAPQEKEAEVNKTVKLLGFEGDGLPSHGLPFPLKGARLVQKFGKYHDPTLGEVLRKGIEIGGPAGPVSVVHEGRIAYVGKMPQIGTVVIVDHGKRDYSLYGRLSDTSAKVGDIVEAGAKIGQTGAPDEQGRTLYFEVRRGGNPVDPIELFAHRLSDQ